MLCKSEKGVCIRDVRGLRLAGTADEEAARRRHGGLCKITRKLGLSRNPLFGSEIL